MYQLTEIFQKCNREDIEFFIKTIDSYVNFSDDSGLKKEFSKWTSGTMPLALAQKIETEIRYAGSSDMAYVFRRVFKDGHPGVDVNEIIDDVASALPKKMQVKVKYGSIESRLEHLSKSIAIKSFDDLKPEQIKEMLTKAGLDKVNIDIVMEKIKGNKALLLPLLYKFLGPKVVQELVKGTILAVISTIIGKKAAEKLLGEIMRRLPAGYVAFLGPILWGISGVWLAFDLSSAASRKTIPIMLYLGIVCLRDGPVDGERFWDEGAE